MIVLTLIYIASGRVAGGKLTIRNRREFDRVIGSWKDCPVNITVEKAHATRSKAQNDFYHAVVVKLCAEHCGNTVKDMHEILKARCISHDMARRGNGTIINGLVIGGSTTRMNKLEFIEYLESCVLWAAETIGVVLPDPDPEWRAHAQRGAA